MIKNYFKIAIRHLRKNKIFTVINLMGLSVGITCCLLIFLYVNHELGYDQSFNNKENIYRLLRTFDTESRSGSTPATSGPYGPALVMEYPDDIKQAVRIYAGDALISIGDVNLQEEKLMYADSNFFQLFSFELVSGKPEHVLSQPNYAVMTEEAALKYFGDEDPIGKSFTVDDRYNFVVTGISRDNFNSTLGFNVIVPIGVFRDRSWFNNWRHNGFYTYVELNPATVVKTLEPRFVDFMERKFGDDFERTNSRQDLKLQSITDIYLNTTPEFDFVPHGNRNLVYSSIGIACFILFIACINFINLSTAKYTARLNEVGIRKVLGAYRSNLRAQFLIESIVLTMLSLILAIALLEAILPFFNDFAGLQLEMIYTEPSVILVMGCLIVIIGIIAGFYPAFFLSSFQPTAILRGHKGGSGTTSLRKILVVLQFSISLILIVSTGIIVQQVDFMQNKELGFDKDQVAIIDLNNREFYQNWESFRSNLLNRADISAITMMSGEPGGFHDQFVRSIDEQDNKPMPFRTVFTDHDYLDVFGMKIISGRSFKRDFATDPDEAIIINRTAVDQIGWSVDDAIGKQITEPMIPGWTEGDNTKKVIGVVEDYHMTSMHEEIEPLIIAIGRTQNRVVGIKLAGGQIRSSIEAIEEEWSKVVSKHPLKMNFLDERLDNLYMDEAKQSDLFLIFSALAIFIGCLGLYGLVAYSAEQRTREIGIRKVHGATVTNIIFLLSRDFSKLVLISFFVAIPLSYYGMMQWLNDFAYRINIGWEIFLLAGTLVFLISWLTVSYESYRAASTDPVKALRYE